MANPSVDNTPPPCETCSLEQYCNQQHLACRAMTRYVARNSNFRMCARRPTAALYNWLFSAERDGVTA